MAADIVRMTEFNGDQVVRHFGLAPKYVHERAAMSFMFRQMKEEIPPRSGEDLKQTAMHAISEIDLRFRLFNEYAPDFFHGTTDDLSALGVAIICGKYTEYLNDAYADEREKHDGNEKVKMNFRHDMNEEIADTAWGIYDDATDLLSHGKPPEGFARALDSSFLAHVLVYEKICTFMEVFYEDECDEDEMYELLSVTIPNAQTFLRTDTAIGQRLEASMDHVMQEVTPRALGLDSPPPRHTPQPSRWEPEIS